MIKITEQPVYKCGFCPEYYLTKHHAEKHDKYCKHNPANKHKCFEFCKHLEKQIHGGTNEESGHHWTVFKCTKLNKHLFSFIAERRNLSDAMEEAERMPLECDAYEVEQSPNAYNLNSYA